MIKIGIGLLVGVVIGLIVTAILLKATKIDGSRKCKYDERQNLARGKAYELGFITLVIYDACYGLYSVFAEKPIIDILCAMFLGICIAAGVMISYCIWHDAYISLNEDKKKVFITLGGISLYNIIVGICNVASGQAIENGQLNFRAANLFCGMVFVIIFIVKLLKDRKTKEEME